MTENAQIGEDLASTARHYIAAFNTRDLDALSEVLADDVAFRTREGRILRGHDGARTLLAAAEDANLRLEPHGDPDVNDDGRVTVPLTVVTGTGDRIRGTAVFVMRDGKVAEFEVVPED
jgi:ketosteroid isomerase-like protein